MIKGSKMSDEQKAKISKAHIGKKKPWSGLYMTDAHKKAISERMMGNKQCLGRVLTDEMKEKIRQSNLGKKHNISEEGRARMRIKNYPVWNKNLPLRQETKDKLSLKIKGRKAPWKMGNKDISGDKNPNYGKFGENHPVWKENKKRPFAKAIRTLFKYKQWRLGIFKRDNFICVLCKKRGGYIEADHYPKRFSDILVEYEIKSIEEALGCEELWRISNGRTLCKKCHDPTKGRYKKS